MASLKPLLRFLLFSTLLVLSACNNDPADLVPDTVPNVGIATVNELSARDIDGALLIPASRMYDPNNDAVVSNPFPIAVVASDERQIYEVALILSQGSEVEAGDTVYSEVGRDILTLQKDEPIFANPFVFMVPFDDTSPLEGVNSGLVPAQLEVVAKDNVGQVNDRFTQEALIDGSLPRLSASVPTTEQSGTFSLSGSAVDLESGIVEFGAFIDGKEVVDSEEADVTRSSFATTVNAEEIGNGTHTLTIYAVNGVNERAIQQFEFTVFKNNAPVAEDDTAVTDAGVSVVIEVLANDTDEDGEPLRLTSVTSPAHGTAVIQGGALIEYTPDEGFEGADTFFYTIADSNGAVDSGQVTVEVQAPAEDPEDPPAP